MKASVAVPVQAASITGSRDAPPVRWPQLSPGACQGTMLLGEWEGRALQTRNGSWKASSIGLESQVYA